MNARTVFDEGVGGPAGSEEAAKRRTEAIWTVGPTLRKGMATRHALDEGGRNTSGAELKFESFANV